MGIETIIHFTSRDRNLMAIQSDLLGAHALGIRNVIALTGDPPSGGDYARASGVWDVDSIGFIRILKMLNGGTDWAGNSIGKGTDFFIACAANPTADNVDLEIDRVRRKLEAGADVLMTQQVYSAEILGSFLERLGPIEVPVLVGIMPLQSHRHTEFIHNELPGVFVPENVRERMRLAGENGIAEGIAHARELLEECRPHVQGTYLVPSFGRYEVVGELVTLAKRLWTDARPDLQGSTDHRVLDRHRTRDGDPASGARVERVRHRPQARRDRRSRGAWVQDAGARRLR